MAINSLEGYDLPVSNFMKYDILDGSIHNSVSFKEKRTIAVQVPTWDPNNCIPVSYTHLVTVWITAGSSWARISAAAG